MNKVVTLSVAVSLAFSAGASAPLIPVGSTAVKTYASEKNATEVVSRASSDYEVFYPAPAGVFYLGLPMDNSHYDVPEYGVAPCNIDIKFSTDIDLDYNDYEWTYVNAAGKTVEADNTDIVMNVASLSVVDAPFLWVQGYGGSGTYTMARGGILFGQGFYENFYATNLNVANLNSEFFNVAALAVNYEDAGKNFAAEYPLKISDVAIKGWGELFRYGGATYKFDALRMALIYTGAEAEANQIEADIYEFGADGKLGKKLATYVNTAIQKYDTYQGSYWYSIEFAPAKGEEAPVIDTDVMVVFRPNAGVSTIISPTMAGTPALPESEPVTSYVIADYTRGGTAVEDGCLSYVGEYESRYTEYCKHWTASGKIVYVEKSSGIDGISAQPAEPADKAVYNILGVKVSDNGIENLPAGLYITNGKKILVK